MPQRLLPPLTLPHPSPAREALENQGPGLGCMKKPHQGDTCGAGPPTTERAPHPSTKEKTMTKSSLRILARGTKAIQQALAGAPLYVINPQQGPVPAGPRGLERALAMDPHMTWIYCTVRSPASRGGGQ